MITWTTVLPTKSDSDALSCLQMLRTPHLNQRGSIDQWCIIPAVYIFIYNDSHPSLKHQHASHRGNFQL